MSKNNIKISFLSLLADLTGVDEIILSMKKKTTVRDVIKKLNKLYGKNFEKSIFVSSEKLNKYLIVSLNGKEIQRFNSLDTILHNGDEILLLPAVAGG